ncbi:MAG: hypothetical protein AB8H47_02280 [Bacteroidia bacterium]
MNKHSHIAQILSLGGFICFMGFAAAFYFLRPGTPSPSASFPKIELALLDPVPQQVDLWWGNNFGAKDWLSKRYHQLNPDLKRLSPLPQKVIMGQEGWLFYGTKPIAQYRKQARFTDYQLSVLRSKLSNRIDRYRQAGIDFQLYILPNKSQVYPEYLPAHFQAGEGLTQAEQVVQIVNEIAAAKATYLLSSLNEAKSLGRLYDKTDTHWNDKGAWAGYQVIIDSLSHFYPSSGTPKPISEFDEHRFEDGGRNLAGMLGMSDQYTEEAIRLLPKSPATAESHMPYSITSPRDFVFADQYFIGYRNPQAKGPRVLFIRDSFSTQLIAWLSEHFRESYYLWDQWRYGANHAIVDQVKADIVVVVMLEEHLDNLLRWE